MLLWIAAAAVFLLALLAIPVDFAFDVERREAFQGRVAVAWMFGLVRVPIRAGRGRPKTVKRKQKRRKRRLPGDRRFLRVIRRSSFRRRVLLLVIDVVRALHVRDARLHVWIGLDDPADTGMLCAWVVPVLAILRQHTEADLLLFPDFEDFRLEASGHVEIRVSPLAMIWVLALFVISPSTLHAGWTMLAPSRA